MDASFPARLRSIMQSQIVWSWLAFAAIHVFVSWLGAFVQRPDVFGDLALYSSWATGAAEGIWPLFTEGWQWTDWVYPVGALGPILLAGVFSGGGPVGYAVAWCVLVTILDAIAFALLLAVPGKFRFGAWWWLAFLLLLGPVALGRLDAVVAAAMIMALTQAARRPRVASVLLAIGTWIKVAPGAVLFVFLTWVQQRFRTVVVPALLVCSFFITLIFAFGAGERSLSFLGQQGDRGLQVESIAATGLHLMRLFGADDIIVSLNRDLMVFEIDGPGVQTLLAIADPLLCAGVLALGVLILANKRKTVDLLLWAALAALVALIVFNKVGSPQYLTWIAAPIACALVIRPASRRWWLVGGLALVTAALTQVLYPLNYDSFLLGEPAMTVVIIVRNILIVALFGIAVWSVVRPPNDAEAVVGDVDDVPDGDLATPARLDNIVDADSRSGE